MERVDSEWRDPRWLAPPARAELLDVEACLDPAGLAAVRVPCRPVAPAGDNALLGRLGVPAGDEPADRLTAVAASEGAMDLVSVLSAGPEGESVRLVPPAAVVLPPSSPPVSPPVRLPNAVVAGEVPLAGEAPG